MTFPILNAGWLQIGVSAFTMHDQAVPPVPPVPIPLKAIPGLIEGPAPMGWPPGFIVHAKQATVLVDGNPGVNQGHDIGYLIPHFAIPMNALCAVHTVFSKHRVMFPVTTVMMGGRPAGTYLFFLLAIICASPVSLPTGVVILLKCTVWTSPKFGDILRGILYIGLEIGMDLLWNRFFKARVPKPFGTPNALQVLGGLTLREMLFWGGHGLVGRYVIRQIGNKAIEHVLKSWVATPLIRDIPRGVIGIGRGILSYRFTGGDAWW
jgi:hypothetical protein